MNRRKVTETVDNSLQVHAFTYQNENCTKAIYHLGSSLERIKQYEYYRDKEAIHNPYITPEVELLVCKMSANKNLVKKQL